MVKLVKENISFERSEDLKKSMKIGKESLYAKEKIYNKLIDEGISFYYTSNDDILNKYLDNIYEIEQVINKIRKLNIPINQVIYKNFGSIAIQVKVYGVLNNKEVFIECVSKEDAEKLIEEIKKYSFRDYENFSIEKDRYYDIYLYNVKWLDEEIKKRNL